MNPDLKRERDTATFSVERLTHLIDGGKDKTERRRYLEKVIERDPSGVFSNEDNHYLHRTDRHIRAIAKHVRLVELCRKLGIGDDCGGEIVDSPDFPMLLEALGDDMPTALHWIMFVPNIVSLCDEEQKAEWLPMCRDWRMIGCYAQTELGHGSNVRALETSATFLPEDKGGQKGGSWVVNSPTITSAKFWPGTLGRTANHAMVIARLIDGDGVDRGIGNFLIQLRSMDDHTLLPGVKTGDVGPKIGYNVMDNGYAQFENVIIPRRNMAMRFAQVDEMGKYHKTTVSAAASKIAYITMMQVRAMIVYGSSRALSMACTINIRYSAVRRQGYAADGKTENQILDYKQQQHRIFPLLAASYSFFFTGKKLWNDLKAIEHKLVTNKPITKPEVADIHASSSALKSFCTTVAGDGIEECRKACGGHGFLECSGLPELMKTYLQNPTVEGDNHMLPQQVIKVLLKLVQAVQTGEGLDQYKPCASNALIPSLKVIIRGGSEKCNAKSAEDMCDLPTLLLAFRHRAARLLADVAQKINSDVMEGKTMELAWNDALIAMARASRAYSLFLLIQNFMEGILEEQQSAAVGPAEVKVLGDLAKLFALYWMENDLGEFFEDGYLTSKQANWVRLNVSEYLDIIRPNAVALVDARDYSDFRLKSALGRYDGNVYPHIMKAAMKDPLNAVDPGPAYDPELKRLIAGGAGVWTGTASRL
jgi:acyl-CoA oxidase